MTVKTKEIHDGRTYEVRTAGRSIRLYTNGAFHTQWHPRQVFQGAVWDLLSLPALLCRLPPKNFLVLGVGGGTVLHQLHKIIGWQRAQGIEIDPHHLRLARTFFDLQYPNLELICADAVNYIESQTTRFDCLIDDIFLDDPIDPLRPVNDHAAWFRTLIDRTTPEGLLVQNHLEAHLACSFFNAQTALFKASFSAVFLLQSAQYANGVLACLRSPSQIGAPLEIFEQRLKTLGLGVRSLKSITVSRLQ